MTTPVMSGMTTAPASTAGMIFLSYRRDDSGGHVGRLYDALSARFGSQRLFVDIDHISAGQDFVQVVDDAVARCAVLLVVIGKRWAGSGRVGKRRIDSPADFVRLEVAGGLRRQGLRVIPVLVGGAVMPGPAELPDDIKDLARRNAFELSDTRWKDDVARLIGQLDQALGPIAPARIGIPSLPKSLKLPTALPTSISRRAVWTGGAVGVVLLALLVRGVTHHNASTASPDGAGRSPRAGCDHTRSAESVAERHAGCRGAQRGGRAPRMAPRCSAHPNHCATAHGAGERGDV